MDAAIRCRLLEGLPNRTLELMSSLSTLTNYEPQKLLFREGEPANVFYIVLRGAIAIEVDGLGARTVLQTLGRGEVLGWSWLFEPFVWHFDARAVRQTRALRVNAESLRQECDRDQTLGLEMYKRFSRIVVRRLQACRLQMLEVHGHRNRPTSPAEAARGSQSVSR